jgi:hypothetical protein
VINIDDLITHTMPLRDINQAFDLMHAEIDPQRGGLSKWGTSLFSRLVETVDLDIGQPPIARRPMV